MKPALYILAGGPSTRFGSDKARALHQGTPLILGIATALSPVVATTTVVSREANQYADLGLTTIADLRPGLGPLGGLETALADLGEESEYLLLASCDLVGVDPTWAEILIAAAFGADAVAFESERGWEPLFGLYRRTLADLVRQRLASDDHSMHGLLTDAEAVSVPTPAGFRQANHPSDLEQA